MPNVIRALRLCLILSAVALAAVTTQAAELAAQNAPAATTESVQFEVFLPLRHQASLDALLLICTTRTRRAFATGSTPEEFAARFGPDADSLERVERALVRRGLTVEEARPQSLTVSGSAAAVRAGLGLDLRRVQGARRARIVAARGTALPAELANEGAMIAAFRPVEIHKIHGRKIAFAGDLPQNRYSPTGPYWFTDIKQAYDFPSYQALTGKGRTIAIVMANDFLDSDMALYFGHEQLAVPKIVRVPVKGGAPFDPDGSFEVSLDIQQAGGMAPKAKIRAYILPRPVGRLHPARLQPHRARTTRRTS